MSATPIQSYQQKINPFQIGTGDDEQFEEYGGWDDDYDEEDMDYEGLLDRGVPSLPGRIHQRRERQRQYEQEQGYLQLPYWLNNKYHPQRLRFCIAMTAIALILFIIMTFEANGETQQDMSSVVGKNNTIDTEPPISTGANGLPNNKTEINATIDNDQSVIDVQAENKQDSDVSNVAGNIIEADSIDNAEVVPNSGNSEAKNMTVAANVAAQNATTIVEGSSDGMNNLSTVQINNTVGDDDSGGLEVGQYPGGNAIGGNANLNNTAANNSASTVETSNIAGESQSVPAGNTNSTVEKLAEGNAAPNESNISTAIKSGTVDADAGSASVVTNETTKIGYANGVINSMTSAAVKENDSVGEGVSSASDKSSPDVVLGTGETVGDGASANKLNSKASTVNSSPSVSSAGKSSSSTDPGHAYGTLNDTPTSPSKKTSSGGSIFANNKSTTKHAASNEKVPTKTYPESKINTSVSTKSPGGEI